MVQGESDPRDSEAVALLEAAVRGGATPSVMGERYGVSGSYISSRIRYMEDWGWIKSHYGGVWRVTDLGMRVLTENLNISIDTVLSARLLNVGLQMVGQLNVAAIRLSTDEIATFFLEIDVDEPGLIISLREIFTEEQVFEDVAQAIPDRD